MTLVKPSPISMLSILYASVFLERTVYFGLRAILFLYMTATISDSGLELTAQQALEYYTTFTTMVFLMPVLGGLIADLLISKFHAIILGSCLFSIGIYFIAIGSTEGIIPSFALITFGAGLFDISLLSLLAQPFVKRPEKLTGVYTVYYLFVNIGAFVGALAIGSIASEFGWSTGLYVIGVLMLGVAIILYVAKNTINQSEIDLESDGFAADSRLFSGLTIVLLAALFSTMYWGSFDAMADVVWGIKQQFPAYDLTFQMINPITIMSAGILLSICWFLFEINLWIKLTIGIFLYAVGWYIVGFTLTNIPTENMPTYLISTDVIFAFSELMVVPILYALVAQYSPRKMIASSFAILALVSGLTNVMIKEIGGLSEQSIPYITVSSIAISMLIIFGLVMRKRLLKNEKARKRNRLTA